MMKFYKYFSYAYLIFAVIFIFEAIRQWKTEPQRAYLSLFFVIVAVGMFFFKRHFRNKYDNNKQDQK